MNIYATSKGETEKKIFLLKTATYLIRILNAILAKIPILNF
jgi:hypothetical protein